MRLFGLHPSAHNVIEKSGESGFTRLLQIRAGREKLARPRVPLGKKDRGRLGRFENLFPQPGEPLFVVFGRVEPPLEPVAMCERELRVIPLRTVRQPYRRIEVLGEIVAPLAQVKKIRRGVDAPGLRDVVRTGSGEADAGG